MALNTFKIETTSLLISKHCRLDIKYYNFTTIRNWKSFDTKFNYIKLSDILEELPIIKFKKGELTEEHYVVNISDQEQRSGDLEKLELTNTLGSDKNYLGNADIFISKLGMPRGYIFINTFKGEKVLGSTEFIPYIIKNSYPRILLKYILLHPVLLKIYSALETGKTPSHKRVNPYEFLKIKIPKIPKPIQDKAVAKIEPIEKKIKQLKSQIKQPQEIINKVFAKEFGFDFKNADKKKKELVYFTSFTDVANEELKFDISLKYRSIFNTLIKNRSKIKWIALEKVVDIKGGKRLPKGQNVEEENTGYRYIRVDDLDWSGNFDIENIKFISESNHQKIKNYIAKKDDILLTIVGATVGKCGIVPKVLNGENITENFARLIIKNKSKYLPYYINYCLQSKLSMFQIDEYKGRGSQGKLALFRIKKLQILDISLSEQERIVNEIKAELDKQKEFEKKIEKERSKIDKIIEKVI